MNLHQRGLILVLLIFSAIPAWASFCAQWSEPKQVGILPYKPLNEISGMIASKANPDRIYWINDSGDAGYLYYTLHDGKNDDKAVTKIKVGDKDYKPRDTEAVTITECPEGPCIAIGDIGDNNAKRKFIEIVFVLEKKDFGGEAPILRRLKLQYPDRAHDAEAMAFLPNGDLYIVTKEIKYMAFTTKPAEVYTLPKKKWIDAGGETVTLEKVGEIPLSTLLPNDSILSHAVTDMAFSTRRQVAILLTYGRAIEFQLGKLSDLGNTSQWKVNRDFSLVKLFELTQQESITYLPEKDEILWSREFVPPETPIYSMTCDRPLP